MIDLLRSCDNWYLKNKPCFQSLREFHIIWYGLQAPQFLATVIEYFELMIT